MGGGTCAAGREALDRGVTIVCRNMHRGSPLGRQNPAVSRHRIDRFYVDIVISIRWNGNGFVWSNKERITIHCARKIVYNWRRGVV